MNRTGLAVAVAVLWAALLAAASPAAGDVYNLRVLTDAIEHRNIATDKQHEGWHSVIRSAKPGEDSYLVYRIDAPRDVVSFTYGGRLYNKNPNSHIELLYSLDGGRTWTKTYSLDNNNKPWDTIHFDAVDKVPGERPCFLAGR